MKKDELSAIKDFNSLDKLKQVFLEQYQNKYDFELYIAPSEDEYKKKFESVFIEQEQPFVKLFDSRLLKEVFPTTYLKLPLTLYVFLGEEKEVVLYKQTLEEFVQTF